GVNAELMSGNSLTCVAPGPVVAGRLNGIPNHTPGMWKMASVILGESEWSSSCSSPHPWPWGGAAQSWSWQEWGLPWEGATSAREPLLVTTTLAASRSFISLCRHAHVMVFGLIQHGVAGHVQ